MCKKLLTPWFDADVRPARKGFYQREWGNKQHQSVPDYFDGKHWFLGGVGMTNTNIRAMLDRRWRGLAKKP